MNFYDVIGPFIRALDPETAHGLAIGALKKGWVPRPPQFEHPVLRTQVWHLEFANPIGLSAGFDKHAEVVDGMLVQGFGFVEVGSVTARPQDGNPRPRLFRLTEDRAVINRMGSNSVGPAVVAERLTTRTVPGIVGVNLGKNKDSRDVVADYVEGVRTLATCSDYLVLNVSSPNTPGLRKLQGREHLSTILRTVKEALLDTDLSPRPPLLLKIAPDLSEKDKRDIAEAAVDVGIDGIIATNTTVDRPEGLHDRHRSEAGGLSGRPLFGPSTTVLSEMYLLTEGKLPLIGCGGVESGAGAYAKIRAGASLVQLYSALVYHGPGLINRIKRDLVELLEADGFGSIGEAVGADHR